MRKCYQTEWHGIKFDSFAEISASNIADASFYKLFYKAFFEKYHNWNELDKTWIEDKLSLADFLINTVNIHKENKILSIGCGLGIIEKKLIEEGYNNLEITEVSREPLRWIMHYLPKSSIHIGFFPECLPDNIHYDYIYLSTIDYCFNDDELSNLLKSVYERLLPRAKCLLISCSFDYKWSTTKIFLKRMKSTLLMLLETSAFQKRRQLWGYIRNRSEFNSIMKNVGFIEITDGLVDHKIRDNYFIQGTRS